MPLSRWLSLAAKGSLQKRVAVGWLEQRQCHGNVHWEYSSSQDHSAWKKKKPPAHFCPISALWQSYTCNSSRLKLQRKYYTNCKLEKFSAPMNILVLSFQNNQKPFVLPREWREKKNLATPVQNSDSGCNTPPEQDESQKSANLSSLMILCSSWSRTGAGKGLLISACLEHAHFHLFLWTFFNSSF